MRRDRAFKDALAARSGGRCEACQTHYLAECPGLYTDAHHVVSRSRGVGWAGLWDPELNGLAVSHTHHMWIHSHPNEAHELGFLAHSWDIRTISEGGAA